MIELLFAILAVAGLVVIAGNGFLLYEQRKLLRQIRKLAALYPPYMPAETDMEVLDQTSVKIDDDWTDANPGRD